MIDAEACLDRIHGAVLELGREMAARRGTLGRAHSKGGVDLVTEADALAERRLVALLRESFPDHGIVAEEGARHEGGAWCWHLDPLDGTANYSRGLPDWALSLGLAHQGVPVAGLIWAPEMDRLWRGGRGCGVCCNGLELPPAAVAEEARTWLLGSDNPWEPLARRRNLRVIADLACEVRMPLMRGSAAVALGLLCSGQIDGYLLAKAYGWDYCAGAALAAELGYTVSDWRGDDWRLGAETMLACRPGMEDRLRAAIAAAG